VGDIRKIENGRDGLKEALLRLVPGETEGAAPVHAVVLFRFAHEMQSGDIVVYPSKHDRMVNIGRFTGGPEHIEDDPDEYPNRRPVEWLGHCPRSDFSQSALNEIGSAVTLFKVKRHRDEFLTKADLLEAPEKEADGETADDETATISVSQQAEDTTEDFVICRIMASLSGHQFEELVAHVLECMGYTARVTQKSGDGGVDVIAHMDALGFQPPIVKVQCKRMTSQIGGPEVNQLLGTLGEGEYGLFVCLGSFSRQATELERNRAKLRLVDGEAFVEMVLDNYPNLSPRYRSIIPLKNIYVPDIGKA
jgi:restriction system protein